MRCSFTSEEIKHNAATDLCLKPPTNKDSFGSSVPKNTLWCVDWFSILFVSFVSFLLLHLLVSLQSAFFPEKTTCSLDQFSFFCFHFLTLLPQAAFTFASLCLCLKCLSKHVDNSHFSVSPWWLYELNKRAAGDPCSCFWRWPYKVACHRKHYQRLNETSKTEQKDEHGRVSLGFPGKARVYAELFGKLYFAICIGIAKEMTSWLFERNGN